MNLYYYSNDRHYSLSGNIDDVSFQTQDFVQQTQCEWKVVHTFLAALVHIFRFAGQSIACVVDNISLC